MKREMTFSLALTLCCLLAFCPHITLATRTNPSKRLNSSGRNSVPKRGNRQPASATRKAPQRDRVPTLLSGQTATLLPNGKFLLIGGERENGPVSTAEIKDQTNGNLTPITSRLTYARSGHTSTLLPDGQVLILGGIGANRRLLKSAELFDPDSQLFRLLPTANLKTPRAFHSATLLTNGNVLIVGGASQESPLNTAELWDTKTLKWSHISARLGSARQNHRAVILSGGQVRLEGGVEGSVVDPSGIEIFDPETETFSLSTGPAEQSDGLLTQLTASLPGDGAADVPIDSRLALRFSKPLRVQTVNKQTVKLDGPEGNVPVRVIPAEAGMLAFVTPEKPLEAGTTYWLKISEAFDHNELYVNSAAFSFTTEGKERNETRTDSFSDDVWIPDASNLGGDWRNRRVNTSAQLPSLRAEEGVTALAGQVLALNGRPLEGVTFRVGDKVTQTDKTGRFLLTAIAAGHQVMIIDGRTASRGGRTYGRFKVGVEVTNGKTNALDYIVWMPKLDVAQAVSISSPTSANTVVVNRHIPGLELHLPAGTLVRDLDGQNVSELSITPIPTNQPPFPLPPGVDVPVYFTIQPGGSQIIPPRAQLIYPNFTNEKPGTRIDFWNYDPNGKGWYVYGQGTVTANSKQIRPDPGVVLYALNGAMVASPSIAPPEGPKPCDPTAVCNDPVDLSTGLFIYEKTDLALPDTTPVILSRTYRQRDTVSRAFGIGTSHMYEMFLVGSIWPYTFADLILPDGSRIHYDRISEGSSFIDAVYEHTATPSAFYKSVLRYEPFNLRWAIQLKDGTIYYFPDAEGSTTPRFNALIGMRDRNGNTITLTRNTSKNLTKITSPNGRSIELTYDTGNRITKAKDNIGREVNYGYDGSGRLSQVTDANNGVTKYTYGATHNMLAIEDARGNVYLTNEYDSNGRVQKQIMADNTPADPSDNPTYIYSYTLGPSGKVIQADVTDPRNNVNRVTFNSSGYSLVSTFGVGTTEQQTVTFERQANTNLILRVTDSLSRRTDYAYNTLGDVISTTEMALTSAAVTTRYSYDENFGSSTLTGVTDATGNTTSFAYDLWGNLTNIVDGLGRHVTYTYNPAGQVQSITDAMGHKVRFGYESGLLTSIIDPEGGSFKRVIDNAGRVLTITDASGNIRKFEYNAVNQVLKITNAHSDAMSFEYDSNGNLLKLTDPRGKITTYTYDKLDHVETQTDFLQGATSVERYEYDKAGNLSKFMDRRGVVTRYQYDSLDRIKFTGFGELAGPTYESTVNYAYDNAGRLHQVIDSSTGTITMEYDDRDRMMSQVTPHGTVNYSYDVLNRRQTMTVLGQPTVFYSYDAADRIIRISQAASVVDFTYDDGDRLISQLLPNGVAVDYEYNRAAKVKSIRYRFGTNILGDLTYDYDMSGRRTTVGGTFARTALTSAIESFQYNDGNRLTQKGASAYTYDANGNLTFDGTNTYTWDARNRLTGITGGQTTSFQYDPFDRRTTKTVNGMSTSFLYDGPNVVQELSGSTPLANLLTGDTDMVFGRTEASGTFTPFTDSLGSVIGLSDSTGTLQTQYTYDPYGATSFIGPTANNLNQYTGRENDQTGLYYYRARYYSPALQRFIAEDPLGFRGGRVNLYSYVGNDPINYIDPFGLKGGPEDLGLGYSARVDPFNNTEGFEIHVFDRSGKEIGICAGRLGWIHKHNKLAVRPPGLPDDVANKLNGLNVKELRARNLIGPKGQANVRGGRYLNAGRTLFSGLNAVSLGLSTINESEAQRDLEMRAKKNGRTPEEQFFIDSEMKGHPQFYITPFGPMRNPYAGGFGRTTPT